jgi:sugar phosphate isomerase/epimerase
MSAFRFGGQAAGLEGISFLVEHGFDFADLNLNEIDKIRAEQKAMLKTARSHGLFFVAHAPDLRVDDSEGLKKIREAVVFSKRFKPRTITIHPILAPSANTPEKIEKKIREIASLAELAWEFGAHIACENTSEAPKDMKPALDAHPAVVLTVDIGHCHLLSEVNKSVGFITAWPDRIGHIHIHDNIGGNTYHEDLHLPLGEGSIEFAPIMKALAEMPSDEITITFEMPRQKAYEGLLWLREKSLI